MFTTKPLVHTKDLEKKEGDAIGSMGHGGGGSGGGVGRGKGGGGLGAHRRSVCGRSWGWGSFGDGLRRQQPAVAAGAATLARRAARLGHK
jgi:hypothetical protein